MSAVEITSCSAKVTDDELHRLSLRRGWDSGSGTLGWVMLNPSTADGMEDDPTIRRCVGFAQQWGYAGIWVGNLFSWRATKPDVLVNLHRNELNHADADSALREMAEACDKIVVGWGGMGWFWPERVTAVAALLEGTPLVSLRITKARGEPGHPLYIPYTAKPQPWCPSPLSHGAS